MIAMWELATLTERIIQAVVGLESQLRIEQAIYGLDSHSEVALHTLLAEGLRAHYEVAREVHYPSSVGAKLSYRRRCDLVLTPKGLPLQCDHSGTPLLDTGASGPMAPPTDGFWMEVKVAYQFREGGYSHRGYSSLWRTRLAEDLSKMATDPLIVSGGLLLVAFTESHSIVDKDIRLIESVLLPRGLIDDSCSVRSVAILDRIGNQLCSVVLWPLATRRGITL